MNGYLRENKGRFHTLGLMIGAAILFVCSSADVYAEAKNCSEPGEFKVVVNREEQYSIAKCYEDGNSGQKIGQNHRLKTSQYYQ